MVFGNATNPRQAKLHFLQEWCVAKRSCLHKHASIAKLSTTLQSFSVVCKIKRATAHCTYKMNVTVFPQLTVLKQKCTKQRLDACFFHCPKACANVKRSHCPNYKKVAPVCVGLLKLQRSNAKKMKKCPRKAYFLQNWVLTNYIFGFII